jgi:hypothetical protein
MRRIPRYIPAILTLLLLAGLTAETLSRPRPSDAEPYHQRVRQAADNIPKVIGEWVGSDISVPPAAVALLRPNVILHRRFVNSATRRVADFLLVQCRDARDMTGHYPPVCYRAHGWTPVSAKPIQWRIADRDIPGMEYDYTRTEDGQANSCVVSHLMILPSGRYVRDIVEIHNAAADYLRQFFGAAQIQIVVDSNVSAEERQAIVQTLLSANLPLLDAICSGGKP